MVTLEALERSVARYEWSSELPQSGEPRTTRLRKQLELRSVLEAKRALLQRGENAAVRNLHQQQMQHEIQEQQQQAQEKRERQPAKRARTAAASTRQKPTLPAQPAAATSPGEAPFQTPMQFRMLPAPGPHGGSSTRSTQQLVTADATSTGGSARLASHRHGGIALSAGGLSRAHSTGGRSAAELSTSRSQPKADGRTPAMRLPLAQPAPVQQQQQQQQQPAQDRQWKPQAGLIEHMEWGQQRQQQRRRQQASATPADKAGSLQRQQQRQRQQQGQLGQQGRSRLQFGSTPAPLQLTAPQPELPAITLPMHHPTPADEAELQQQQQQQSICQFDLPALQQQHEAPRPEQHALPSERVQVLQPDMVHPAEPEQQQQLAEPKQQQQQLAEPGHQQQQPVEPVQQQQPAQPAQQHEGQQLEAEVPPAPPLALAGETPQQRLLLLAGSALPDSLAGWTPGPTPSCIKQALAMTDVPGWTATMRGADLESALLAAGGAAVQGCTEEQLLAADKGVAARQSQVQALGEPAAAAEAGGPAAAEAAVVQPQAQQLVSETPAMALPPSFESPLLLPPQFTDAQGGGVSETPAVAAGPRPKQLFENVPETPADALPPPTELRTRLRQHVLASAARATALAAMAERRHAEPSLRWQQRQQQEPAPCQQQQRQAGAQQEAEAEHTAAAIPGAAAVTNPEPATEPGPGGEPTAAAGGPELRGGMQLAVCRPVLLAAAAPDGRHLALLLSSHSLPQEPSEVLVLRLLQPGEGPESASGSGGGGPAAATSVAVVAAVEVQRSQWGEALQLGPNCLQLAVTAKGDPVLVLSAALLPADGPPSSLPTLSVITFGGSGSSGGKTQQQQQRQVQQGPQQRRHRALSIERPEALTAVLTLPGHELLAAGDGGGVRRLCFNPLWTAFTWGERELEPAECGGQELADIQHLALLPPRPEAAAAPVQPPPQSPAPVEQQQSDAPPGEPGAQEMTPLVWHQRRRARLLRGSTAKRRARAAAGGGAPGCLLAGLSSDGSLAVWDLGTGRLLATHVHPDYQLLSLAPLMGLFRAPPAAAAAPAASSHQPEAAAAAAAAPAAPALPGPLAFLCLARCRQTGRRAATAAVLSAGGLLVLGLEPVADGPAAAVCCHPGPVACATIAGRCGLLVSSQGRLACWDLLTGLCTTVLADCCAGAAALADPGVTSLLLLPAGGQGGVPEGGGGPGRVGAVLLTSASGQCNLLDVTDLGLPEQLAQ